MKNAKTIILSLIILLSALNLFSAEKSFIFYDKGDLERAKKIDPDVNWVMGYGLDCLILDYYNPNAKFSGSAKEQAYATDAGGNKIMYSIGDGDSDNYGLEGGQLTFSSPHGIAGFRDGSVWVADTGNKRVVKLSCDGYEMKDTGIKITGLVDPWGVEVDKSGMIFIADKGGNKVLKYSGSGLALNSFNGTNYINSIDGVSGYLSQPLDIAIDPEGKIYIIDSIDRLSVFSSDGKFVRSIRLTDLNITGGSLASVDIDNFGNVYLLEKNNRLVIKLTKNLTYVDSFGGAGEGDLKFEAGVNSLTVFGTRGGIGVSTEYGAKLFRIGPGLHDTVLDKTEYSPYKNELAISYKITSECNVDILVLDKDSTFIRQIKNDDPQGIGSHTVYWDGKDMIGHYCSLGDYKIKIIAATAVETPFSQEIELPFAISYGSALDLISVTPETITPDSGNASLKYELTKDGKPVIDLVKKDFFSVDEQYTLVTNLYTSDNVQKNGEYYYNFNGKDSNGDQNIPDYLYTFSGKSIDTDGSESPVSYKNLGIDRNPIDGNFGEVSDSFNPNTSPLVINYYATEDCYSTITLYENKVAILDIREKTLIKAGLNSFSWDGKEKDGDIFKEGQYILEIKLDDITGYSHKPISKNIYINSEAPLIKDVFVSPLVFTSTSYNKQNVTLYYTIEDKYFNIFGINPFISIKLYNEYDLFIKDILTEQGQIPGKYSNKWDGTGSDNTTLVADGAYYFQITAKDNSGNTKSYLQDVIKNNIASKIDTPYQDQVLKTKIVDITGTATNLLGFKYFTLDYAKGKINKDAITSSKWNGIKVVNELRSSQYPDNTAVLQVQNGLMANWDIIDLEDGDYTIKLSVYDREGISTDFVRNIKISNPVYIANLRLDNNIITPDGDGFQDDTKIYFDLSKNAAVIAKIYDKNNAVIKDFNLGNLSETIISKNPSHYFNWDGKNNSGVVQPDGQYKIEVEASRLILEKDKSSINVSIQVNNNPDINASIEEINDQKLVDTNTAINSKTGSFYKYKASFTGQYYAPKKVKLRLGISGIQTKKTVNVPTYGGPYVINNAAMFSTEWNGITKIGPYPFIDSQGKTVYYDSPLTCILDGGEVSQVTGFNTVGETSGQLKIFYQNIADSTNTPKSLANQNLTEDQRNKFALIKVRINSVESYNSFFYANLYNEPKIIDDYQIKFSLGTVSKVWYYSNAPVTYYGNIPYNDSVVLIATLNKDSLTSFELTDPEGKNVTSSEIKDILSLPSDSKESNYEIEVIGVVNGLEENNYLDSPDMLNLVIPYFESKGQVSLDKNKTVLPNDKIKISSVPDDWDSKKDSKLMDGYFYSPEYVYEISMPAGGTTINVPYNQPAGITLYDNDLNVNILNNENEMNRDFKNPEIINNKSFKIIPANNQIYNKRLLDVKGHIECQNLDHYMLSCYDKSGKKVIEKTYYTFIDRYLGVFDFTGISEGEYNIVLDVFSKDGKTAKSIKRIIYTSNYNPIINSVKSENQKIKINYSLDKDSIVALDIINPGNGEIVNKIVDNAEHTTGIYENEWNGFNDNNTPSIIDDDVFYGFKECIVRLTAQDKNFTGSEFQKVVLEKRITLADIPINADITLSSNILSPDGDGINDSVKLTYIVNEPFIANIGVYNNQGLLIKQLVANAKKSDGNYETIWDGRDNSNQIVQSGTYSFNVTITPLDGGSARTIIKEIQVKPSVAVDPSLISITYPCENEIVSSTSGTIFSYNAIPKGIYYPPQTVSYSIKRNGQSSYKNIVSESHHIYETTGYGYNDFYLFGKSSYYYYSKPGWLFNSIDFQGTSLIYDYCTDSDILQPTYGKAECYASNIATSYVNVRTLLQQNKLHIHINLYGFGDGPKHKREQIESSWDGNVIINWYQAGFTDWSKTENGIVNNVDLTGTTIEASSVLTGDPIRPDNLGNQQWISNLWKEQLSINSLSISGNNISKINKQYLGSGKYSLSSTVSEAWNTSDIYYANNYPIVYSSQIFSPDRDENSYNADLFLQTNALTKNQYIEKNVGLNGWEINLNSPNETAYIIDNPNLKLLNSKIIYNDGIAVTVGTKAEIPENGKFKVILDKNKEKKFLKIKGKINTDILSYKVFVSPGTDISDANWTEVYQKTGKPDIKDDSEYVFYNWEVTNLYGPYIILVRVEKNSGSIELTRKVKLGNKVTRGIPCIATSPYNKATLSFAPDSVPESVEDQDPNTPEHDIIVDILPISGDDIDTESGMSIVGPVFDMKPNGIKFDKPVSLQYKYTDEELNNWAKELNISTDRLESRIGSYHVYKDANGNDKLEYVPGYIDRDNNILTVMISGFSKYALAYDDNSVEKPVIESQGLYSKEGFIDIKGKSEKDFKVKIYLNGTDEDHFKGYAGVDEYGNFIFKDLRLEQGKNEIYAQNINTRNISSEFSSIEIEYDDINPVLEILKIDNINFSSINPAKQFFKTNFRMNEDGRIRYDLKSANGISIKTGEVLSRKDEIKEFSWDGTINGIWQPEGNYKLILSSYDNAGNCSMGIRDNCIDIILDNTSPQVDVFSVDDNYISPNGDGNEDDCSFAININDNLSKEVIVDLNLIDNNGTIIKKIINKEKINTGSIIRNLQSIENKNLPDGDFKAVLKIFDIAGNESVVKELNVSCDSNPPADISLIKTSYDYFSPNNDGIKDTLPLNYELLKDSDVYIFIYDSNNNLVNYKILKDKKGNRSYIESIDGKNIKGEILPEGEYRIDIRINDKYGNMLNKKLYFTIDNTPPVTKINLPVSNQTIEGNVTINGTSKDQNFECYTVNLKDNSTDYNEIGRSNQSFENGNLFSFDSDQMNGSYTIKVSSFDKAGNSSNETIDVILNNPVERSFLNAMLLGKDIISVINYDKTYIGYKLKINASLSIYLKQNNNIIKTIKQNESTNVGSYTYIFDGKDESGINYPEGSYTITISATSDNTGITVEKGFDITIDNTAPLVKINSPQNNSFTNNIVLLNGDIIDDNLLYYYVEYGLGDNPDGYIYIAEGNKSGNNIDLAKIDTTTLLNSLYSFRITAIDRAGNSSVIYDNVVIDNKNPESIITSPKNDSYFDGNNLEISGTIFDENILSYLLEYKLNNGNSWNAIKSGSENITNSVIGILDKKFITENLILKLTVIDKSGNVSVSEINLKVDNIAPVVKINSPVTDSYQGQTINITGKIFDANLKNYKVFIGQGKNPSLYSQIYQGYSNVDSDSIFIYGSKGLSGEYTIKVEAADLSGKISADSVSFKIDSKNPSVKIIKPLSGFYTKYVSIDAEIADDNEIKHYVLMFGIGNDPAEFIELTSGSSTVSGNIFNWDTSLLNGEITLLLKAYDKLGNEGYDKVLLNFDNIAPEIIQLSLFPTLFHPLAPINTANLKLNISEDSYLTIEVFDSSNNFKSKILNNYFSKKGDFLFPVSGRIDNNILDDGIYNLKITSTDKAGNFSSREVQFEILYDLTSPYATLTDLSNRYFSPNGDGEKDNVNAKISIGDNKNKAITVKFYITDINDNIIRNFPEILTLEKNLELNWDGRNDSNSIAPDGEYKINVALTDALGNKKNIQLTNVILDTIKPELNNLNASEPIISPNYDGIKDYSIINFTTSEDTNIDLSMYFNENGQSTKVHTLSNNEKNAAGDHKYFWIGEGYVKDGNYDYVIKITDLAGNTGEEKTGIIKVDLTPPQWNLNDLPAYLKEKVDIKGSIIEENFERFKVFYKSLDSEEWILMNESVAMPDNNLIASWDTGALANKEGFCVLKFIANDKAGLSSSIEKCITVDNLSPDANFEIIETPYHNNEFNKDFYKGKLTIKASINDSFLAQYELFSINNDNGTTSKIDLQTNGITNIDNKIIGVWDTTGLDGNFTLKLTAIDKSGNETAIVKSLNIDSIVTEITDFSLTPSLISPKNKDNINDLSVSSFKTNEDIKIKSKIISSNVLYNWQATGYGTKKEYPDQNVNFRINADGFKTEYPEQTFDYGVEFKVGYSCFIENSYSGFEGPIGISVSLNDGSIWVADMGYMNTDNHAIYNDLIKLDQYGNVLVRKVGMSPLNIAVNPNDDSIWVTEVNNGFINKLDSNGNEIFRKQLFDMTYDIFLNPNDGSLLVIDIHANNLVKLDSNGNILLSKNIINPRRVIINPNNGNIWVSTDNNMVIELDSNFNEITSINGLSFLAITLNPVDGSLWGTERYQVVKIDNNGNIVFRLNGFNNPISIKYNISDNKIYVADWQNNQIVILDTNGNELTRVGFNEDPYTIGINQINGDVWVACFYGHNVVKLSKNKLVKYNDLHANSSNSGINKNLLSSFKNIISSQGITGQFKVNGSTSSPVPAYNPGTTTPHPYVKVYIDNKGTADLMDDEVIATVDKIEPYTINTKVPWTKSLDISNIKVNAKNPVIIDIYDQAQDLLNNGQEIDLNGNPSNFSIGNISNSNVNVVLKTYQSGTKVGRHYIEITAKPETIITDVNWRTPVIKGSNYMVSRNSDNSHNIYLESGYSLPISNNFDYSIQKWNVNLVRFNGTEDFTDAYIVGKDNNGFIYNENFTVKATGDAAEIKVFSEYTAGKDSLVNNTVDDWDGTGQSGNTYVPDGDYLYYSEIFDKANNRTYVMKNIFVDNTPPVVLIADHSGTIIGQISIVGDAYDTNRFKSYELRIIDAGTNSVVKTISGTNPIVNNELIFFDPDEYITSGTKTFTLALTAYDEAGNKNEIQKNIIAGSSNSLFSLSTGKQYISPKNSLVDISKRRAKISVELLYQDDLFIDVYNNKDLTGTPVCNLVNSIALLPSEYTYYWEGKNNDGTYVEPGNYYIKIRAAYSGKETVKVQEVIVDDKIDLAKIMIPINNQYLNTEITSVNVSITEPNLSYYSLSYKKSTESDAQYIELLRSNNGMDLPFSNKKIFEFIVPPFDEKYDLRLKVEDLAGNTSIDMVQILRDTVKPAVSLNIENSYEYNGRKLIKGSVNIRGSVYDKNLQNYILSIKKDSITTQLAAGNNNIDGIILSNFNSSSYPDGDYTLILEANDNNNQYTMMSADIRIDNTVPQIKIITPENNSYVKSKININFTVSDYLSGNYKLQYCINNSNEWKNIAEGICGNNNSYWWDTASLNGNYDLKIIVTDKIGNQNEIIISLIVDNVSPVALITSPSNSQVLNTDLTINGIAGDINFNNASLSYKKENEQIFNDFGLINTSSVGERELGKLNISNLSEGKYKLKLSVFDKAGNTGENIVDFMIDNNSPQINITSPLDNSILEKIINISGTIKDFTLKEYRISIGEGKEPLSYELISKGNNSIEGGLIYSFNSFSNGKILNGDYTFKIEANDNLNNITTKYVHVYIDNIAPDLSNFKIKYQTYSPYDNPQEFSFNLSERSYLYASIVSQSNLIIKTISNNQITDQGNVVLNWDGKDNDGNFQINGFYKVVLYAIDSTGKKSQIIEELFEYIIDNIPPEINDIIGTDKFSPNDDGNFDAASIFFKIGDNKSQKIKIIASVCDSENKLLFNIKNNEEYYSGNIGIIWDGKDTNGKVLNDGVYNISIKATDGSGNSSSIRSNNIIIDNTKPDIINLSAIPEIFSPNDDGINDNVKIDFNLSDNNPSQFNAKVTILDYYNNEIAVIYDSTDLDNAIHSIIWNGNDKNLNKVIDGQYKVKLEAWDDVYNKNEKIIIVRSDGSLPIIDIHSTYQIVSETDNLINNYLVIAGNIYDANLLEYKAYYTKGNSSDNWTLFFTGNENKESYQEYYPEIAKWNITGLNGQYTIKFEVTDYAGSITIKQINVNIDTTVPVTELKIKNTLYNNYYSNMNNEFTFSATDPVVENYSSGVDKIYYQIDMNDPTVDINIPIKLLSHGLHSIAFKSIDKAGNFEIDQLKELFVDTVSPIVDFKADGLFFEKDGALYGNGNNTYTISTVDMDSGIKGLYYNLNENDYSTSDLQVILKLNNGLNILSYYSVDNVWNISIKNDYKIISDITPPESILECNRNIINWKGDNYTYPDAKFKLTTKDDISGIKNFMISTDDSDFVEYDGKEISFDKTGTHKIKYYAIDNVLNNEEIKIFIVTMPIPDRTAPVTKIVPTGFIYKDDANNNYCKQDIGFNLTAEDILGNDDGYATGVDFIEYRIDGGSWTKFSNTIYLSEGIHSIEYRSYDKIPNIEDIKKYIINIDDTKPVSADDFLYKNKWINYVPEIIIKSDDPVIKDVSSGINKLYYEIDSVKKELSGNNIGLDIDKEGISSIKYHAIDNVGNVESEKSFDVCIDRILPEIIITGVINQARYGKNGVTPQIQINDINLDSSIITLSKDNGIEQLYANGAHISEEGYYILKVIANDLAGNISQMTVQFTIDLTPPVNVKEIKYLIFKDKVLLNWMKVSDPDLTGYNIYRNGVRLNSVVFNDLYFNDILTTGKIVYKVTSVDDVNNESAGTEITLVSDNSIKITYPKEYDYYNGILWLSGVINNNITDKLTLDYSKYENDNIVPDNWTNYKNIHVFFNKFASFIFTKNLEDGNYVFRIKSLFKDGYTREICIKLAIDNTKPKSILYVKETDQTYETDSKNIKEVVLDSNATITLSAIDPVVNGISSGIRSIYYTVTDGKKFNMNFIYRNYFKNWNIYKGEDLKFEKEGIYYLVYYSIDKSKIFGNRENYNIVKLNIKNFKQDNISGNIPNFSDNFGGITLIKPPEMNPEGNVVVKYPIKNTSSILNITPDLSIYYDSSQKDSIFGMGWNINIPYITGNDIINQLHYDNKIILINKDASSDNYNVIDDDNKFIRVYKNANEWNLFDKNGIKYVFSINNNHSENNQCFLEKVIDQNGNSINYNYEKRNNKIYPIAIKYNEHNNSISYYRIEFEYYYDLIQIQLLVGSKNMRKYELIYEFDKKTNDKFLNEIKEYCNDNQKEKPYVTKIKYAHENNLLDTIENPIKGKIVIDYNNKSKMESLRLFNEDMYISSNHYEYHEKNDYLNIRNIIDGNNYYDNYYYKDGVMKDKLYESILYKDGTQIYIFKNAYDVFNGRVLIVKETIINNMTHNITVVNYQYDNNWNTVEIDKSIIMGQNQQTNKYFIEYANNEYISKIKHSYAIYNGSQLRNDEKYYYYDNLEYGLIDKGNMTKEEYISKNGVKKENLYYYNEFGKIINIIYANGTTYAYNYEYITNNFLTGMNKSSGENYTFEFDVTNGNILSKKDNDGNKNTYEYDDFGRLKKITMKGIKSIRIEIEYLLNDKEPRITITKKENNQILKTELTYDSFGRVLKIKYPDNHIIYYKYENGLLKSIFENYLNEYIKNIEYDSMSKRTYIEYGDKDIYEYDISNIDQMFNAIFNDTNKIEKLIDLDIENNIIIYEYVEIEKNNIIKIIYDNDKIIFRKENDADIWHHD